MVAVNFDLFLFVPVSKYAIFTDAAAFPCSSCRWTSPTAETMSAPFLGNSPSGQCCSTVCWLLPKGKEHLKFHTLVDKSCESGDTRLRRSSIHISKAQFSLRPVTKRTRWNRQNSIRLTCGVRSNDSNQTRRRVYPAINRDVSDASGFEQ